MVLELRPVVRRILANETNEWRALAARAPLIKFLRLSHVQLFSLSGQLAACWAEDSDKIVLRRFPVCEKESIVGQRRRRKQAHDEHHGWIGIRQDLCVRCGRTFTFLPVFSRPYAHYSLFARSWTLLRRFAEHCSREKAAPKFKDAVRQTDPSTVRRWSSGLDVSRYWCSFLDRILAHVTGWHLARDDFRSDNIPHIASPRPITDWPSA